MRVETLAERDLDREIDIFVEADVSVARKIALTESTSFCLFNLQQGFQHEVAIIAPFDAKLKQIKWDSLLHPEPLVEAILYMIDFSMNNEQIQELFDEIKKLDSLRYVPHLVISFDKSYL